MNKVIYTSIFALLATSCASKQMQSKISLLEKQNEVFKNEINKLQSDLNSLNDDLLVVQTRIEHQQTVAVVPEPQMVPVAPVPAPVQEKKLSSNKPMGRSFFDDDIQFSDEEPALKFTNKDLSQGAIAVVPSPSAPKPKMEFTETTLIEDANKMPTAAPANPETGIQDPAIVASYNKAYRTFKEQNYRDTIQLMSEFLKQYPTHPYADNATFWIGESYFQLKEYQKANAGFEKVIRNYPNGNKVPDALLRSGICQLRLSRPDSAKSSFDLLVKKYPESLAAKRAMTTLGEL